MIEYFKHLLKGNGKYLGILSIVMTILTGNLWILLAIPVVFLKKTHEYMKKDKEMKNNVEETKGNVEGEKSIFGNIVSSVKSVFVSEEKKPENRDGGIKQYDKDEKRRQQEANSMELLKSLPKETQIDIAKAHPEGMRNPIALVQYGIEKGYITTEMIGAYQLSNIVDMTTAFAIDQRKTTEAIGLMSHVTGKIAEQQRGMLSDMKEMRVDVHKMGEDMKKRDEGIIGLLKGLVKQDQGRSR